MLDILMTAHFANYPKVARRGFDLKGQRVILGCLPTAVDRVGTPGKVVLSLEGGNRQDFESAEAYLQQQALPYQIVHSDEVTSYRGAMMRGLDICKSPLVAIIPGYVEVRDPQWVSRMIYHLGRDPTALLVGTWMEQGPAKDLAAHIVKPRTWPGGEFFVARRDKLRENLALIEEDDFYDELAKTTALNGWRIWAHPGVRFTVHEHHRHARKKVAESPKVTASSSDR